MLYLVLKLIHVLAVIMFLGNITTGLYWKLHADRAKDPRDIAHAFEGIRRSDLFFTIPGVIVIIAAGVATAIVGEWPILGTGWILWAIILFGVSGIAFGWQIVPLQAKIARMARDGATNGTFDWDKYHAMARAWELWGLVGLLPPVAAVALMVIKPVLPAF